MKVLYMGFIDINNNGHIGVRKKIFGQIEAMRINGIDVDYILHENKTLIYYSNDTKFALSNYKNGIERRINMLSHKVIDFIEKNEVDVVYIRYPISDILFIRFLKKLKNSVKKIYLEIPTYPYDYELKKSTLMVDRIYRKHLKKYIDHIVVSSGKYENIFGVNCKFIDNCVNINDIEYTCHQYNENKKEINLISVAFLNSWHGYDRIIEGMHEYYSRNNNNYDIKFKIVGIGDDYDYLKKLSNSYNLDGRIEFLGVKSGLELDELFASSDLALGSLAIHRKNLKTVSSLKLREYCARGIPFIYAGDDPGFTGKEEFLLKVESTDDYIDMDRIIEFYEKLKFNKINSIDMRRFAEKKFEWRNYYKSF